MEFRIQNPKFKIFSFRFSIPRVGTVFLLLAALVVCRPASAQYYSWGADAPSFRWRSLGGNSFRVIYPDTLGHVARQSAYYISAVQPDISHGFRFGAIPDMPFVMHPENFQSNGLTMWMPKRIEYLAIPDVSDFSMPWHKHLTAHEYRHAVQYNNLNRGVVRVLSWFLGQQGSTVGLLFLPLWVLEGDAVMFETQTSTYGRGLQPSFTLTYRALGREVLARRNPDKWFCGSFRDFVPNHYNLGYQLVSYSYERYGDSLWSDVGRYGVRNPYVFFTVHTALKKYAGTTVNRLFRDTFSELNDLWAAADTVSDSGRRISPPAKYYTHYEYPQYMPDGRILSLKYDLAHAPRFVMTDASDGSEQPLRHTGLVSTRPVSDGRRIWWTEYRRSRLFEERVNSRLCFMEPENGKIRTVPRLRNVLYPTPAGDSLAWIEYRIDGRYLLAVAPDGDPAKPARRVLLPPDAEIHGLAWDDVVRRFYVLVTDDSGMWIAEAGADGTLSHVTDGAYITLSNLRAGGGKLYFGSIASGKDEAHVIELRDGVQHRITESRYGAFYPSPSSDGGTIVMAQYARDGYHLAEQSVDEARLYEVPQSNVPVNAVNPPRRKWDVVNLDTVNYAVADTAATSYPTKRFRRASRMFNLHSWMPVSIDVFGAVDEHSTPINLGATVLSQNLLSTMQAYASYGWSVDEGSMVMTGLRYNGLGVRLSADFKYGGAQQVYSVAVADKDENIEEQPLPPLDRYWSLGAGVSLPLLFDCGYHVRQLSLSAGWNYSNGMVARIDRLQFDSQTGAATNLPSIGYTRGVHKLSFGAGFSDNVRMAYRDFLPRWGYAAVAEYAVNPTNRLFSDMISLYARAYLPGVAPHHSLSVAAAWQTSVGGRRSNGAPLLGFKSSRLIPEGYSTADIVADNYTAVSGMYRLPVWYPEGGIPAVLYVSRVRLGAGFAYASFDYAGSVSRLWSYGVEAALDMNLLRLPAAGSTTLTLKLFRTRHGRTVFSAGFGLPF